MLKEHPKVLFPGLLQGKGDHWEFTCLEEDIHADKRNDKREIMVIASTEICHGDYVQLFSVIS